MRFFRSISPNIAIGVTVALVLITGLFAIVTARIVLLKDLSLQSAIVLAEWNGLDLTTNDILLSRSSIDLEGRPSWFALESEFAERMVSFEQSLNGLANHPALNWVTSDVVTDIEDAVYSWNYTKRNLLDAKKTLQKIAIETKLNNAVVSGLLYEFYSQLLTGQLGVSETTLVLNFLNQIGILDTAGTQFSRLIRGVNHQIGNEVETNIQRIQILAILFVVVLVLTITIVGTLVHRAKQIERYRTGIERAKRQEILNSLLMGEELSTRSLRDAMNLVSDLDVSQPSRLLVFRIVNNRDYCDYTTAADRDIHMEEAIKQILKGLSSIGLVSIGASWESQIVILLYARQDGLEQSSVIEEALPALLERAEKSIDWPLTVVSSPWTESSSLPHSYEKCVQAANYYVLVGSKGIHSSTDNERIGMIDYDYPMHLELQLQDSVLSQRTDEAIERYREIIDHASEYGYAVLKKTILRTALGVASALETLGRNNGIDIESRVTEFIDKSTSLETLSDYESELFALLQNCFYIIDDKKANKNSLLVEQVELIIEEHYADPSLGIELIASKVHRSPSYLGRIYRSARSESIADAINRRRLQGSAELLLTTEMSVNEVSRAVGMTNTSYFYTLFKKNYGTTPKDYRTNMDTTLNSSVQVTGARKEMQ